MQGTIKYGVYENGHLGGNVVGGDPFTYYPALWDHFITKYNVKSILDVGCGEGYALNYFKSKNVITYGIDGAEYNIKKCIEMGHTGNVIDFTEKSFVTDLVFDLGWCCEVVEHVEEQFVNNIIHSFKTCRIVAITHAVPQQKGYHHVNCKDQNYWIDLFVSNDFEFLVNDTNESKHFEQKRYFKKTGLIFKNKHFS